MPHSPSNPESPVPAHAKLLEYAPRPPAHRRRFFRRVLLTLASIVIVAGMTKWGPAMYVRLALLYHQRGCMNYTASPDQVVFDSDPVRVAKLASDPNLVISKGCAFRVLPRDWQVLEATLFNAPAPRAVIFLHERHAAGGASRIVAVERTAGAEASAYFIGGYDVDPHVIEPASFNRPLRDVPSIFAIDVMDSFAPHTDIRIYAGQPDPADASHFTIRYESRGATHIVDGFLGGDGRVTMKRRHEAADGPE